MTREEYYAIRVSVIKCALFDLERALKVSCMMDVEANLKTMREQFHLIEHELYRGI